jgi:hypothetical protein
MSIGSLLRRQYRPGNSNHIDLYKIPNNQLELRVFGLQENDGIDERSVATIIVDYPDNIALYDVIKNVLDKLTEDHYYKLRCFWCLKNELCGIVEDFQDDFFYEDKIWTFGTDPDTNTKKTTTLGFTPETIHLLGESQCFVYNIQKQLPDRHLNIIYGKVSGEGVFTYDAPIVGMKVDAEYYRVTRGRRVWDISYDKRRKQYYENNWEELVKVQWPYFDAGDNKRAVHYGGLAATKKYL